ncbi:MAG: hypothetical protein SCABRO_00688 [Candidatus Scalindua brodae]|uniref:Uncharacterized protein n=1 Tax=Candidatus Scalindua brodae TaxID=237368 RepID=A0A0B0EQY5_9BACT|nr:MAG: hypothetical protein SCABRO_00688 [Candidatus Scalindua brodae]
MFRSDINKSLSDIILDPYSGNDILKLVNWYRQDFINSVIKILEHKTQYGSLDKKKSRLKTIYAEIHNKRVLLDDIERACQLVGDNDYNNIQYREFMKDALNEAESDDDARYEKKIEELNILSDRIKERCPDLSLEKDLLLDIRKRIAEIYFYIDKIRRQERRITEWQQHGPPSSIRDKFKKYMKNSQTNPFEEADSEC